MKIAVQRRRSQEADNEVSFLPGSAGSGVGYSGQRFAAGSAGRGAWCMAGAVDDLAGSLASHIAVARTLEAQLKADHLPQSLEVFVSAFDQHLTGFQHHVPHVQRQLSQAISRSFSPKTRDQLAARYV